MSSTLLSVSPLSSSPAKVSPSTFLRSSSKTHVLSAFYKRRDELTSRIWASSNDSQGKRRSNDGIRMVDPLEAKRLAAKQLQEIQAKEKLRQKRRIEAINGAWAMIGLTVGLVIEGQTGKNILSQQKRRIEAINGAWAMIGLTVGLVIEGQTGKNILSQLAGYWIAIFSFFTR